MSDLRRQLETHAARNREELAAGKARSPLPPELCDLYGSDLSYANLAGANLRGAYLTDADLRSACLYCADLTDAYLTDAYLAGVDLCDAEGLVELPVADPRGHRLLAVQHVGGWLLFAGCRGPWTVEEARAHWGAADYDGDPLIARRYLHALDWWERDGEAYRNAAATGKEGDR